MLSWASSSPGFSPSPRHTFRRILPWAYLGTARCATQDALRSLIAWGGWLDSPESADPPEVSRLLFRQSKTRAEALINETRKSRFPLAGRPFHRSIPAHSTSQMSHRQVWVDVSFLLRCLGSRLAPLLWCAAILLVGGVSSAPGRGP
jgi:hypothetical protein